MSLVSRPISRPARTPADVIDFDLQCVLHRYRAAASFHTALDLRDRAVRILEVKRDKVPSRDLRQALVHLTNAWVMIEEIQEEHRTLPSRTVTKLRFVQGEIDALSDPFYGTVEYREVVGACPDDDPPADVVSLDDERRRRGLRVPTPRLTLVQRTQLARVASRGTSADSPINFASLNSLRRRGLVDLTNERGWQVTPLGLRAVALHGIATVPAATARDA